MFLLHVSLTSRPQKYSIWFIGKSNTLNSLNIEPSFFSAIHNKESDKKYTH